MAKSLLVQWRELTGKELAPKPTVQGITKFLGTVEKGAAVIVPTACYAPPCSHSLRHCDSCTATPLPRACSHSPCAPLPTATILGPVKLRFHLLPPEHRVVVTPAAVKKATGIYYARIYGGGDKHAVVWDGAPSSI